MKEKLTNFIKSYWKSILIVILIVMVWNHFEENRQTKLRIEAKSVPDIELINTIKYNSADQSFAGNVAGFVRLNNKDDQPKKARQYFTIQATDVKSVLILDEIIALDPLPAQSIGRTKLFQKSKSGHIITLEDQNGLQLFFDKNSGEISLEDSILITSNLEFRDFMQSFLKR